MMLRRADPATLRSPSVDELPDVSETMRAVRERGDAGVADVARRFGDPAPRVIDAAAMRAAYDELDRELRDALEGAGARIGTFARIQRESLRDVVTQCAGFELSHRALPLRRAGVYVPGGRYPLPSSLLMGVIPARVAGVESVIVCTPAPNVTMLAAAHIAGADRVFVAGGAQAVAALAYGTESIPRVDIIAGPGNRYVAAAKRAVAGVCGIDAIAGPSEILVIASGDADARAVAADLLAQAEHDEDACVTLLTDDVGFANAVDAELARQLPAVTTRGTAREALLRNGRYAVLPLEDALALGDDLAPEHLELQGARAEALAPLARCYGALFVGRGAAEVFGDYGAGPNHILPTAGAARFSGGLSVLTFLAVRTTMRAVSEIDSKLLEQTLLLASVEGLDAHRGAARLRTAKLVVEC
jgi:histidinol dehydrogenase